MTSPNVEFPVRLEAAFGADPADPDSWVWTDLSDDLKSLDDQVVVIKRGRADEAGSPAPTSVKFQLDNRTGDYTPTRRASQYYPYIRRGVPIRFSVWYGGGWEVRFVGFAESWTPTWPLGDLSSGDYLGESFVTIDCAGPLRRLASNRAMVSAEPQDSMVAQWGTAIASLYGGVASEVDGVQPARQMPKPGWSLGGSYSQIVGMVPDHTDPAVWTAWGQHWPNIDIATYTPLDVRTSGFVWQWQVRVTTSSVSLWRATGLSGLTQVGAFTNLGPFDGRRRIALSVAQTTANRVTWRLIYTLADQPADGVHIVDQTGTIDNTPNPLGRITQLIADS